MSSSSSTRGAPAPVSTSHPSPPGVDMDSTYHHGVPTGPPPGLIRTMSGVCLPPRILTDEDVTLFADIAPYLDCSVDADGRRVCIDITCMICQMCKLVVSDNSMAPHVKVESESWETMMVMPCGHFFGSECLMHWLCISEKPLCPLCRLELVYEYCGHRIPPRQYDPGQARVCSVPMTWNEGGAFPSLCCECVETKVDEAVCKLQRMLFPLYCPEGDLRFRDSMDELAESSMEFRRVVLDFERLAKQLFVRW